MEMTPAQKSEHAQRVDAFLSNLRCFLIEPDHADSDWPDISHEELQHCRELVGEVFELKWARDCDGDSPIRFAMLDRRRSRSLWDVPVSQEPRDDESMDAAEARLQRDLSIVAGGLSTFSRELDLIQRNLDRLRRTRLCLAAAFEVFQVEHVMPEGYTPVHDRPLSVHLTLEAAEAFFDSEYPRKRVSRMWAVPDTYADSTDDFADYRKKVEAVCGKVVPRRTTLSNLNFRSHQI